MIPNATTENLSKAPPENILNISIIVPLCCSKSLRVVLFGLGWRKLFWRFRLLTSCFPKLTFWVVWLRVKVAVLKIQCSTSCFPPTGYPWWVPPDVPTRIWRGSHHWRSSITVVWGSQGEPEHQSWSLSMAAASDDSCGSGGQLFGALPKFKNEPCQGRPGHGGSATNPAQNTTIFTPISYPIRYRISYLLLLS